MVKNYREQLDIIKKDLISGKISYETARKLADPIILKMNDDAAKIAIKHGRRPYRFSFGYLMR